MKYIIFPKESHEKKVDSFFKEEWDAAKNAGFEVDYAISERIKDNPMFCGAYLPKFQTPTTAIYRGWIVRTSSYFGFYESLKMNNKIELINNSIEYKSTQLLSESYSRFSNFSIPSVFIENPTKKLLKLIAKQFKTNDIFLKDYVKNEHNLNRINAGDLDGGMQIIEKLKQERHDMFEGGFAFRPFVELSDNEYRLWIYKGKILNLEWETLPKDFDLQMIKTICRLNSSFYTVDIGRYKNTGKPVIIETGDGQVSGLKGLNPNVFYNTLKKYVCDEN